MKIGIGLERLICRFGGTIVSKQKMIRKHQRAQGGQYPAVEKGRYSPLAPIIEVMAGAAALVKKKLRVGLLPASYDAWISIIIIMRRAAEWLQVLKRMECRS